jgi:sugar-specific transcriptional regulator TrmB
MDDGDGLLAQLDLTEYEETALTQLLALGRTTAPDLAEATGIPKARIYGVLDDLSDRGFVKVIPGRPKVYQSKPPAELVDRAIENHRQSYERRREHIQAHRETFVEEFGDVHEQASDDIRPTEELFYVVDVGEPSETETRALYHDAGERVSVLTKSFDYIDAIEPELADAVDRGVDVSAILHHPRHVESAKLDRQAEVVDRIRAEYPSVDVRFSERRLPWRGTIADPSMAYESGKAVLLVDQEDVPNHLRQAAVTETPAFVAGLARFFDLVWEHESVAEA